MRKVLTRPLLFSLLASTLYVVLFCAAIQVAIEAENDIEFLVYFLVIPVQFAVFFIWIEVLDSYDEEESVLSSILLAFSAGLIPVTFIVPSLVRGLSQQ